VVALQVWVTGGSDEDQESDDYEQEEEQLEQAELLEATYNFRFEVRRSIPD
jgi:hypothetical protein